MSLFGLFPSPDWLKFTALPAAVQRDLAFVIHFNEAIDQRVWVDLAEPFIKLLGTEIASKLNQVAKRRVTNAFRLSFLSACAGKIFRSAHVTVLPPERLVECVGMLALSEPEVLPEIADAEGLKDLNYSEDGDEARTQVLVQVLLALGKTDMLEVGEASDLFFADAWNKLERDLFGRKSSWVLKEPAQMRRQFERLNGRGRETILALGTALIKKADASAAPSSNEPQKPFDAAEYQKAHPLLYVPFPRLVDLFMAVADDTHKFYKKGAIDSYELKRYVGAKAGCSMDLLEEAIEVDTMVYAYAAVVAAAASCDSKFVGSGVWKKLTETFEKRNSRGLQSNAELAVNGTLGPVAESFVPGNPRDFKLGVNLMAQCRKAASGYLSAAQNQGPDSANLLFEATTVLKGIANSPAHKSSYAAMVNRHLKVLRKQLDELAGGEQVPWSEQKDWPVK